MFRLVLPPLLLGWILLGPTAAQEPAKIVDYTALGQPDYAQRIGLTDAQIAQIAVILDERLRSLAAKPDDREAVFDAANQKLAGLLTEAQQRKFAELVAGGKLRFNFREERWADVLDWFASQAGLSLVMDQEPAGTFTYSDAKNYTPTEAIDLLNSVLQSKAFTLVRREKMLVVAATADGIPYDMVPKITVQELADRGRFEYVSVLLELEGRPVDAVSQEVQAFLGTHGRATPLPQTGQLLVVDTAGRVAAIEKLVKSIPKPRPPAKPEPKPKPEPPPPPVLQVHSIAGLNLEATLETLKSLFGKANLTGDPRAEQVTAFAPPAIHSAIEKTLSQMRANVSGDREQRLEVYAVQPDEWEHVQTLLAQTAPGIQMTAEPESGRLFVVGDTAQHEQVRDTLQQLEVLQDDDGETVVLYSIEEELGASLVAALEPLLPRATIVVEGDRIAVRGAVAVQRIAKQAIEQFQQASRQREQPSLRLYDLAQPLDRAYLQTIRELLPQAQVSEVRDRRQLAVVATREEHVELAQTLQQLQADMSRQPPRTLQTYDADKDLRARFEKVRNSYQQEFGAAQLIWDYRPQELAVVATAAEHAALSALLERLRTESDEVPELQKWEVAVADPQRLLSMAKRAFPQIEFVLSEDRRNLLGWVIPTLGEAVEQEVSRLQAVLPPRRQVELRTYESSAYPVAELAQLLAPVAKQATLRNDEEGRRLLVWATPREHTEIESTLKILDRDANAASQRILMAYPLTRSDVNSVVEMLRGLRPEIAFAVDEKANQVLATATLLEHRQLGAVMEQLDAAPGGDLKDVAQSYTVKSLPPSTVVSLLQSSVPQLRLTPNDSEGKIAAFGSALDHEWLKQSLLQLDRTDHRGKVVSYPIGEAKSDELRNVLLQLVPRALISAQPESRTVVVWADEEDHRVVAQAVEQFKQSGTDPSRQLRSYPLPRGMGDTVLFVVRSVAPSATMDIDQSQGEVVVWGTSSEHDQVTKALSQLAQSKQQVVRGYPLEGLQREPTEEALEAAHTHVTFLPAADPQQLLVLATPATHELLERTLKTLQAAGPTSEQTVRVYPIDRQRVQAAVVLDALAPELRDKFWLESNGDTNSVIARGLDTDHAELAAAIEAIVKQLPLVPRRVPQAYFVKLAEASAVRSILRSAFPEASFVLDDENGSITATALAEEQEQIAVLVEQLDVASPRGNDRRTEVYRFREATARSAELAFEALAPRARVSRLQRGNAVVVTASPQDHEQLRELAKQLEGEGGGDVRVYPIDRQKARAEDIRDSLDDALADRFYLRVNDDSNAIIARGPASDQETLAAAIEVLVAQLPVIPRRETKVYPLRHADPDTAERILRQLLPDAELVADDDTRTLSAAALAEEHKQIQDVVQRIDVPRQDRDGQSTEVYRLDRIDAGAAQNAFERMARDARVTTLPGANALVATAEAATHRLFAELLEKMEGQSVDSSVKVYPLDKEQIDVEDVLASIDQTLLSRVAVRMNEATNSLIVRGTAADQQAIGNLIEEILAQVPPLQRQETKVYRLAHAQAQVVQNALRDMFEQARVVADDTTRTVAVTATAKEQERMAALVEQLDQPLAAQRPTRVYRLKTAQAAQVTGPLAALVPDGRVAHDDASNSLIVTASEEGHQRVEQVVKDLDAWQGEGLETKVYPLTRADPGAVQAALVPLLPRARFSSDPRSASLIVSASAADHVRVRDVVSQLDQSSGQQTKVKAYPIRSSDAKNVYQALSAALAGNGKYSISFQEPTKTLFVIAKPEDHVLFAELFAEMDRPTLNDAPREAKAYPLTNIDAAAAKAAMTAMLEKTSPAASVETEGTGNSLIVVGTAQQHAMVSQTLTQLVGPETLLEVFQLDYVDPWSVETAVETLFRDAPRSSAPSVSSDYTTQRLFVRGTEAQVEQIRGLLRKMGESEVVPKAAQGDVRTIPFRGNIDAAVEQMQSVWPRLRPNRIQVVTPSEPSLRLPDATPPAVRTPSDPSADRQGEAPDQEATPAPAAEQPPVSESAGRTREIVLEVTDETDETVEAASVGDEPAAVLVIPQDDRITIASSDHEALDQMEAMLRAMSRRENDGTGLSSDFAVFLLRNTGASDMGLLLADLFEQLRENASPLGPDMGGMSFGPSFGDVAVVADDRLNALIIHGDRKERELIEELLRVLDTKDLPNPIVVYQPELVTLANTEAERVLTILRNVYRSQLTTGGGRKSVEIPEGVSSAVAAVLQQINAAAAAPVLTLDIDQTTNSIVMRAPPELRQEIKAFVSTLDQRAATNQNRNVRVIRLQDGKSDRIREALEQFMLRRD